MKIFVEGESDRIFLNLYLRYLNINKQTEIVVVDGKDNIIHKNEIEKIENKFLIIFDADNDFETAKNNIKGQISQINSNAQYEIFLFPNDKDTGNLETLYAKIVTNAEFIGCFEKYEACIGKKKLSDKSKLFAYLEACNLSTKIDKIKSDQLKQAFDFGHDYINPLEKFLLNNLRNSQ
ncbi:MAG: hypothetical protein IKI11_01350 [Neisseriaceae bacterium]|nr:hypothetical protein [Neisseriaceae bacterium]